MRSIGFTGTRVGMTWRQFRMVSQVLRDYYGSRDLATEKPRIHLGDCLGADMETFALAEQLGFHTVGHLPASKEHRAFCSYDEICGAADTYMNRNRHIVQESNTLLAAPKGFEPEQRSGTWATIRYAGKVGRLVTVVFPDGLVMHNYVGTMKRLAEHPEEIQG